MNFKQLRYRIEIKTRLRWWQVREFVTGLIPVQCGRCGTWRLERDTQPAQTTMGIWVRVCNSCHQELYGE